MAIEFQPADYVLAAIAAVMAVTGLFRGFSGTLAFVVASIAAAFAATFGWPLTARAASEVWMRSAIALVGTLLVFGLVRILVKKCVNGMLAQPTDAIFGFLTGAIFGLLLIAAWGYSGLYLEYSGLAKTAASFLPQHEPNTP